MSNKSLKIKVIINTPSEKALQNFRMKLKESQEIVKIQSG